MKIKKIIFLLLMFLAHLKNRATLKNFTRTDLSRLTCLSKSLSLSLSLKHTHTHTHTYSLSLFPTHIHTHTCKHTQAQTDSLSHTNALTCVCTHSLSHTHKRMHSLIFLMLILLCCAPATMQQTGNRC